MFVIYFLEFGTYIIAYFSDNVQTQRNLLFYLNQSDSAIYLFPVITSGRESENEKGSECD